MRKSFLSFCLILALMTAAALAGDEIRQVQEELRKRNLYFGDINGLATPDLASALKRYQARKGFAPTGKIDEMTASSLNVRPPEGTRTLSSLPDVPILKSDFASALPETERIALQEKADQNPDAVPTPPPPAEAPDPAQNLNPERVNQLVEQYLRDAETSDIPAQTRYFTYPVSYFNHGAQDAAFVEKDVKNYVKRWPERKYTLLKPANFVASERAGETIVEFPITYQVRAGKRQANGKTMNTWIVRPEGDELKIVAIQEQQLRE